MQPFTQTLIKFFHSGKLAPISQHEIIGIITYGRPTLLHLTCYLVLLEQQLAIYPYYCSLMDTHSDNKWHIFRKSLMEKRETFLKNKALKNCLIGVTRPTLFLPPTLNIFIFCVLKRNF